MIDMVGEVVGETIGIEEEKGIEIEIEIEIDIGGTRRIGGIGGGEIGM